MISNPCVSRFALSLMPRGTPPRATIEALAIPASLAIAEWNDRVIYRIAAIVLSKIARSGCMGGGIDRIDVLNRRVIVIKLWGVSYSNAFSLGLEETIAYNLKVASRLLSSRGSVRLLIDLYAEPGRY